MSSKMTQPDTSILPSSLFEWRSLQVLPLRKPWDPLEDWFHSRGLEIMPAATNGIMAALAPKGIPRAHDGFYVYDYTAGPQDSHMHSKHIHCFARTVPDGRDVLIRLISKGAAGHEELDIQRYISSSSRAFLGDNHCLIMQRELSLDDMVFGVFPALQEGFMWPWYNSAAEVFDAVIQLLEGLAFLHQNFIAHRDIGAENILINFVGWVRAADGRPKDFRSSFPIRYYYIDFELSVRFPENSDPSTHLVTGLPLARYGLEDPEDYGRDIAPEMLSKKPYDPFKTDIFQLGKMFHDHFHLMETHFPDLIGVFARMMAEIPADRPTALEALNIVRDYRDTFTGLQLKASVAEPIFPDIPPNDTEERKARKAVRKAAEAEAAATAETKAEEKSKVQPEDKVSTSL